MGPLKRKIVMKRVALVTGGGRGIGAEVCRVLANAGLQVVAADIDVGAARSTAASLGGEGHAGYHVDVADEESVEGLFEAVERDTGYVSILVCNAGRLLLRDGKRPLIHETSFQNWQETFAVNTVGPFLCSRALGGYKRLLQWSKAVLRPAGRIILWQGTEDSISLSRTKGWNWELPVKIPESRRRVVLMGSRASSPQ